MNRLIKTTAIIAFISTLFCFKTEQIGEDYGIKIEKSIQEVGKNLYLVTLKIVNGNEVNGFAKYETKLPLSADYIKEIKRDKAVSFKLDGRKLKLIWIHIQKNKSYTTSFQISTKKSIKKLNMDGRFFAHFGGEKFSFEDNSENTIINLIKKVSK
tara:strand:+ start:2124 stop:2588 length:465 start_codon:yes stop_codon:yes gene_type:complete